MILRMIKRKKRKMMPASLFWVIFTVLIAFGFFLNKDTISHVLSTTNAKSIFVKDTEKEEHSNAEKLAEIHIQKEDTSISRDGSMKYGEQEGKRISAQQQGSSYTVEQSDLAHRGSTEGGGLSASEGAGVQAEVPDLPGPRQADEQTSQEKTFERQPVLTSEVKTQSMASQKSIVPAIDKSKPMREAVVYWILIDPEGKLIPMRATRALPKSASPMSDALQALFASPTVAERKQGLRTLVPPETKLRSAWIKDGIAFINVSEEFQFNQYGIDGSLAQLAQVVFTATEFSTVQSVQFLIEGQKRDYLGAEGVWIGTPLSRASF